MQRRRLTLACLPLMAFASAQDRPYREGDVDAFLAAAKRTKRPAVVLFNFDDKSG